jgi:outer membrane lipoprotein-sorting protein
MSESIEQEKWYSIKEFACSFGQNQFTGKANVVSVDTVQRWIRDGDLVAFEYPRKAKKGIRVYIVRLISESERTRFINENLTARRPVGRARARKAFRLLVA